MHFLIETSTEWHRWENWISVFILLSFESCRLFSLLVHWLKVFDCIANYSRSNLFLFLLVFFVRDGLKLLVCFAFSWASFFPAIGVRPCIVIVCSACGRWRWHTLSRGLILFLFAFQLWVRNCHACHTGNVAGLALCYAFANHTLQRFRCTIRFRWWWRSNFIFFCNLFLLNIGVRWCCGTLDGQNRTFVGFTTASIPQLKLVLFLCLIDTWSQRWYKRLRDISLSPAKRTGIILVFFGLQLFFLFFCPHNTSLLQRHSALLTLKVVDCNIGVYQFLRVRNWFARCINLGNLVDVFGYCANVFSLLVGYFDFFFDALLQILFAVSIL